MKGLIPLSFIWISFTLYSDTGIDIVKYNLQKQRQLLKDAIVEEVKIYPLRNESSQERIMRRATLIRYPNAVATIVLCHGFLCSKDDIGCFRNIFPAGRFNFLIFDFRGHGKDAENQVSTLGRDEAYDVIAAAQLIRNHEDEALSKKPVISWGFSMGSVASAGAQVKDPTLFDAMIFDCPFDSSEELVKNSFDQMRFSLLGYKFDIPCRSILEKYALHPYVQSFVLQLLKVVLNWDSKNVVLQAAPINLQQSVQSISVPCFFIQCKNDQKVPLDSVKRLYEGVQGYKRLWITNGRRHFDSFFYNPELYTYRVHKFLNQFLSGELFEKNKEKIIEDGDEYIIETGGYNA